MDRKLHGWIPQAKDPRDLLYSMRRAPLVEIKAEVDLEEGMSPVEDQEDTSSCVGNMVVALLEFLEIKNRCHFHDLSRMMVYYGARKLRGIENEDGGCVIRDAFKWLAKYGTCHEETWTFTKDNLFKEPSSEAYTEAKNHTLIEFRALHSRDEILRCLSEGFPVGGGFTLFEGFTKPDKDGNVEMPKFKSERPIGEHAMAIVGHKMSTEREKLRNSWGPKYGVRGYCFFPMDYVDRCGSDFWTARSMKEEEIELSA